MYIYIYMYEYMCVYSTNNSCLKSRKYFFLGLFAFTSLYNESLLLCNNRCSKRVSIIYIYICS